MEEFSNSSSLPCPSFQNSTRQNSPRSLSANAFERKEQRRREQQNVRRGKPITRPKLRYGGTARMLANISVPMANRCIRTQTVGSANASVSRKSGTEQKSRRSRHGSVARMFVFVSLTASPLFSAFEHS